MRAPLSVDIAGNNAPEPVRSRVVATDSPELQRWTVFHTDWKPGLAPKPGRITQRP